MSTKISTSSKNNHYTDCKNNKQGEVSLIANVLNTEYTIIKEVLENEMKCKLCYDAEDIGSEAGKEWDLYWHDLIITPEQLSKLKPYQKVNHFPGMEALYKKNLFGANLSKMRKLFPEEYAFFPSTWNLPADWNDFKLQFNGKPRTFIIKPETGSQGRGIYLTRRWDCIGPEEHCVAQRYLARPFLIDGLKFDLRIYVLVYGCDPYRIYMHKEGLVRLATEPYVIPKGSNLSNQYVHLTNYAINKGNRSFEFNTNAEKADRGHKRSLEFAWKYIDANGGDSNKIREEIKKCIVKVLCAVQPQLAQIYKRCQPNDLNNNKCFEILGFDIMFDQKLRPCLIEVNHAPSFNIDSPFDRKVKSLLLKDTFRLINLDPHKKLKYKTTPKQSFMTFLTEEEREEKKRKKMMKRDEYELKHLGSYELLYPNKEYESEYEKYIKAAAKSEESLTLNVKQIPKTGQTKKFPEINKVNANFGKTTTVQTKKVPKSNKTSFKQKDESKSMILNKSIFKYNTAKSKNNCTNILNPKRFPYKETPVLDIKKNRTTDNDQSTCDSLVLFSKLKKSIEKKQSAQIRRTTVTTSYTNEPSLGQSVNYGVYIAPKVIEFVPIGSISRLKVLTASNNKWNPCRIYKPILRLYKPI